MNLHSFREKISSEEVGRTLCFIGHMSYAPKLKHEIYSIIKPFGISASSELFLRIFLPFWFIKNFLLGKLCIDILHLCKIKHFIQNIS